MSAWIGIDVSKESLEVCLLLEDGKTRTVTLGNNRTRHRELLPWARRFVGKAELHFCMEATGPYWNAVAEFLVERGQTVSVVNPYRVKHAAMAQGAGNKTDRADAKVLAQYCRKESPAPWQPPSKEVKTLAALQRRVESVQDLLSREKNRKEQPGLLSEVKTSLQITITFLEGEIKRLRAEIDAHIDRHANLKEDRELLTSIQGIGDITAITLMAKAGDIGRFEKARSLPAFFGLNPTEYQSGTSVKKGTRISKRGNSRLRQAVYLPAMTAVRYNPVIKAFYERLIARGMHPMAALGAAMRKLLMLAYGVLKSRKPFEARVVAVPVG